MSEIRTRGWHPKIARMKEAQELHEQIKEDQEKYRNRLLDNREQYECMLAELKRIDPNFLPWFEDDTNIPPTWSWEHPENVFAILQARIELISGKPYTYKKHREKFYAWEVSRPAKRGKRRVTVTILNWYTKADFSAWWRKYSQPGWKARMVLKSFYEFTNRDKN